MPITQRLTMRGVSMEQSKLMKDSRGEELLVDKTFSETVGCLQQLADLALYSNEIFSELLGLSVNIHDRIDSLAGRTAKLQLALPKLIVTKSALNIHGDEYQHHRQMLQNPQSQHLVDRSSLPNAMKLRYCSKEVNARIQFHSLDKYSNVLVVGPKAKSITQRYSNPEYFLDQWCSVQVARMKQLEREKKQQKVDKKTRKNQRIAEAVIEQRMPKRKSSVKWQERYMVDGKAVNRKSLATDKMTKGKRLSLMTANQPPTTRNDQEQPDEEEEEEGSAPNTPSVKITALHKPFQPDSPAAAGSHITSSGQSSPLVRYSTVYPSASAKHKQALAQAQAQAQVQDSNEGTPLHSEPASSPEGGFEGSTFTTPRSPEVPAVKVPENKPVPPPPAGAVAQKASSPPPPPAPTPTPTSGSAVAAAVAAAAAAKAFTPAPPAPAPPTPTPTPTPAPPAPVLVPATATAVPAPPMQTTTAQMSGLDLNADKPAANASPLPPPPPSSHQLVPTPVSGSASPPPPPVVVATPPPPPPPSSGPAVNAAPPAPPVLSAAEENDSDSEHEEGEEATSPTPAPPSPVPPSRAHYLEDMMSAGAAATNVMSMMLGTARRPPPPPPPPSTSSSSKNNNNNDVSAKVLLKPRPPSQDMSAQRNRLSSRLASADSISSQLHAFSLGAGLGAIPMDEAIPEHPQEQDQDHEDEIDPFAAVHSSESSFTRPPMPPAAAFGRASLLDSIKQGGGGLRKVQTGDSHGDTTPSTSNTTTTNTTTRDSLMDAIKRGSGGLRKVSTKEQAALEEEKKRSASSLGGFGSSSVTAILERRKFLMAEESDSSDSDHGDDDWS